MFSTSLFIMNGADASLLIKVLFYMNFVLHIRYYIHTHDQSLYATALLVLFLSLFLCGHSGDTYANDCSSSLSSENVMLYAADSGWTVVNVFFLLVQKLDHFSVFKLC